MSAWQFEWWQRAYRMEPITVICGVFFFIIALFFLLNFWTNYLLAKEERRQCRDGHFLTFRNLPTTYNEGEWKNPNTTFEDIITETDKKQQLIRRPNKVGLSMPSVYMPLRVITVQPLLTVHYGNSTSNQKYKSQCSRCQWNDSFWLIENW